MAVRSYTLTLTGAAQRLSQVLPTGGGNADPTGGEDLPFRQLRLQADPANANVVYVGDSSAVSATAHGGSLDPTEASAQVLVLGPFPTGPLRLSDLWVLGTNTQRLMVLGVPF